ncbi:ABC transporter permease [Thiosulfativibrio zosterae]|uniref:ABC transporter permease n=1 Tax=Thiosulfativibrio zosterae TaxID=2675053 RepID=A0A6F8PP34_9GAMM|nr:ABC transporter permease [Thiosulfativibrio zosterae]BBP43879.1 ABC transporter permease [Thiosulfativibrio zosterae]
MKKTRWTALTQSKSFEIGAPIGIFVGALLIWQLICVWANIPEYFLPTPLKIAETLVTYEEALLENGWQTLKTTVIGFAISVVFGVAVGAIIGNSKTLYNALYPLFIAFETVPKVAVVPILVLWFGIGTTPAIITAWIISFFPIVVNVSTGLATLEPEVVDVMRALKASKRQILFKVGIPNTLPYFFGALKISITLAFVGSVVAETVAANSGIGHLMLSAQANFDVPLMFAGMVVLAVEGLAMYTVFAVLEKRMTRWAFRN